MENLASPLRPRVLLLLAAIVVSKAALAQIPMEAVKIQGEAGGQTVLGTYGCVHLQAKPAAGSAEIFKSADGSKMTLVLTSDKDQLEDIWLLAETGTKEGSAGRCEAPVAQRNFLVSFQNTPTVSRSALSASFNVLVAAFVLALLLESAFALLFNWRLFQVYFVGKAWRTPIMLGSSWLVVEAFNFDLMAALMAAYYPGASAKAHGWYTSLVTAMTLAGGSVGVNRILTTLGFRSQLPNEDLEREELRKNGVAWISVKVDGDSQAVVQRTEASIQTDAADIPMLVGLTKVQAPKIGALLFGDSSRIPRSGGFKLDTDKCHKISVVDSSGQFFDLAGRKIASHSAAPKYRFAPGAIVDFRLKI